MEHGWAPPPQIDEFRVERRLGRGGMGDVWLARDTLLDRDVAIKFAAEAATDEARLRFRVEARAVASLNHPNILDVHHAGELADRPFLVTELLRGTGLDRVGKLPAERVIAIGADLARALAAAHAAGVIHRDVKPANAFLCEDGAAKLLDFGLASLAPGPQHHELAEGSAAGNHPGLRSGALDSTEAASREDQGASGTPMYMAPETWRGEVTTRFADTYSLGALLHELLTGKPPYVASTIEGLCAAVLAGHLPDLAAAAPEAPASLVELVLRCLSLRPDQRPTAEEVCNALQTMLGGEDDASEEDGQGDADAPPYRGLLSFGAEHRGLFHGREGEIAGVLTELRGAPFVLVVGTSGAGKSSLVRAGVLPRVLAGALGADPWRVATMVPGSQPLQRLGQAFAPLLEAAADVVARELTTSPAWVAQRLGARGARRGTLLFVDQFEEAWTLAEASERARLFEALAALADVGSQVRVVVSLRADFLSRLEDLGELGAQALRAPVVIGPLSSAGLRRAIVEPARRRGVEIEPDLVEHLVAAAAGATGMLPLLQFALTALWERRDLGAGRIAASDLQALGGLEGALASHADAVLARLSPALQTEARRLLLALVTVERTRARREERELLDGSALARSALEALVDARIVVVSAGEETSAYEVAHEVLLSGWPSLRGWLEAEDAARGALERVRRASAEWVRLGRDADALFSERRLEELDVLAGRALPAEVAAFVTESRSAIRTRRAVRRGLALGVPLAILLAGITAWGATELRHRAAVMNALRAAREMEASAEAIGRAADAERESALALFDRDDLGPAEELWKKVLSLEDDAERQRGEVGSAIDEALALDPRNVEARGLGAEVMLARLLAAERLHRRTVVRELRARLEGYDDASRVAVLRAPAHLSVETEPRGATLLISRYREDDTGRLVETEPTPLAAAERRELEPGSYLLAAGGPDRYPTRYPFLLHRGEERSLRVVLPRAAEVPDGMSYVPAGRFLYGSGDDEATRSLLAHQPIHEIELGAFLIGRTEVTNADYVAFLTALSGEERQARLPDGLEIASDGRIAWKRGDRILAPGQPYCSGVQPCVDWLQLPVDGASREDGEHFAAWLSGSRRLPSARLCSDREWERAARGADDRRYPSGNGDPGPTDACSLSTYGADVLRAGPCAAGSHPASRSPFGVDDLVASEWEWTSGPADVARPQLAAARSAGWNDYGISLVLTRRSPAGSPRERLKTDGLRICADVR